MNSFKIIHQVKRNDWAVAICQQQESSMSVTSWCKQSHLSTTQFYYWKRKLKDQFVESQLPDIVPSPLWLHNSVVQGVQQINSYTECPVSLRSKHQ